MNKKVGIVLLFGVAVLFAAAWVATAEDCTKGGPGEFKADYEKSGKFFTLMSGMVMGKSPHKEVQIWYSNDLKDLVGKETFTAPVGAVSIKPFNNDGKPGIDGYAVMVKKEAGYDTENGDWFYEMRTPAGEVMQKEDMPMAGKLKMCIGCHAAASGKDYLAGTGMK